MSTRQIGFAACSALSLAFVVIPTSALAITFTTIDFPGARDTFAYGMNAEGDVVGAYTDQGSNTHGILLHQGALTTVDFPGAIFTEAFGVNERGDIVGTYIPAGGSLLSAQGFLLHQGIFTTIAFPGAARTEAFGINSRGDIVGFYDLAGAEPRPGPFPPPRPFHGFVLHQGTFTTIDFPGAFLTEAQGINSEGDIVGLYNLPGASPHGFALHQGYFTTIDPPGALFTEAHGINPKGDIVGLYGGLGPSGVFLLQKGTFTTFDFPGAIFTFGFAINPKADIVGSYFDGVNFFFHGFLLQQ